MTAETALAHADAARTATAAAGPAPRAAAAAAAAKLSPKDRQQLLAYLWRIKFPLQQQPHAGAAAAAAAAAPNNGDVRSRDQNNTDGSAHSTSSSSTAAADAAADALVDITLSTSDTSKAGAAAAGADADALAQLLPPPTVETLVTIHRLHRLAIPFENLIFVHPVMRGTERLIEIDDLHRRIVDRNRGGMCQEQNKLLRHHLEQLGFQCYSSLAAVVMAAGEPPATPLEGLPSSTNLGATQVCGGAHQIVFVRAGGHTWLCDVGFGSTGIMEPLLLRAYDDDAAPLPAGWSGESEQAGSRFRLRRGIQGSAELLPAAAAATHPEAASFVGYYLQGLVREGVWADTYWFTQAPVTNAVLSACAEWSFHHHPLFTRQLVVCRALEDGRITLSDRQLKVRRAGRPTEVRTLSTDAEVDAALTELFGIDMTAYP